MPRTIKRLMSLLMALVLLCSTVYIPAYAAGEGTPTEITDSASPTDGEGTQTDTESTPTDTDVITLSETKVQLHKASDTVLLTAATVPAGSAVTWTSADPSVATVEETGLVTAVSGGRTTVIAAMGEKSAVCEVIVGTEVFFTLQQENTVITVSDYKTFSTVTDCTVEYGGTTIAGKAACLTPGTYTYTATCEGYYGSTCGFTVAEDGAVAYTSTWTAAVKAQYGLDKMLDTKTGTFHIDLEVFTKSANTNAWDGVTLDISWFTPGQLTYYISTPAQFAGLAALVNGIYNDEVTTIIDDINGDKMTETYTVAQYNALPEAQRKVTTGCSTSDSTGGSRGFNQVTSDNYYYNANGYDFFIDPCDEYPTGHTQTVYLTADLDMGGYQDASGNWTGARYMPIGGQYQMYYVKTGIADGFSHLGSSFNGTLNGQGHIVYNIYCDRYSVTNFGDSQGIGLVGRLGDHDNDNSSPAVNPTVRNVAVAGYIYGRRSVGGIVGKTGYTSLTELNDGSMGAIIENCVNFAEVHNTDAKGAGGIVGACFNGGIVRNCANFGYIHSVYADPTGGIIGYNENSIVNCYNVGTVKNLLSTATDKKYAEAIGSNNGGTYYLKNNYWLTGSAAAGGYYNVPDGSQTPVEITDNFGGSGLSAAAFFRTASFTDLINGTGRSYVQSGKGNNLYPYLEALGYAGAPVPRCFADTAASVVSIEMISSPTTLIYPEGATFDAAGLIIRANWSDGTSEILDETLTYSITGGLKMTDTQMDITAQAGGKIDVFKIPITVVENSLKKVKLGYNTEAVKAYNEGDPMTLTGFKVVIEYANGNSVTATWNSEAKAFTDSDGNTYDVTLFYISSGEKISVAEGMAAPAGLNGKTLGVTVTEGSSQKTDIASTTKFSVCAALYKPAEIDGVYQVSTGHELDWVAFQVNNGVNPSICFVLTSDLYTTKDEFAPIGQNRTGRQFTGTFDGQGHTVTLSLTTSSSYAGLFGAIGDAAVKNVTVKGWVTSTYSSYSSGGIAGVVGCIAGTGLVENCHNEAEIAGGSKSTGTAGIVGYVTGAARVSSCTNAGAITGQTTGGIVGYVNSEKSTTVANCCNTGTVEAAAEGSYAGGIAGALEGKTGADSGLCVSGCCNQGAVTGYKANACVGGLVGMVKYSTNGAVINSYNTAPVTGSGYGAYGGVGGLVGHVSSCKPTVRNVYNIGTVTNTSTNALANTGSVAGFVAKSSTYDGSCNFSNYYWLEGTADDALVAYSGYNAVTGRSDTGRLTLASLTDAAFASMLGDSFKAREGCGTGPMLTWETVKEHHFVHRICTICGAENIGDLNDDGIADVTDLQTLYELLRGEAPPETADAADCNGDGYVNILDYQALYELIK